MALPDVFLSEPEKLFTGFQFTEGPVWLPEGYLLFSDIPASRIYKWSEKDGLEVWRDPSLKSNGLALDTQGRLVVCEQQNRRVIRINDDGTTTALAERWQGKRFNSPNDVVVRSDGTVYFSDPTYYVEPEDREIDVQAFYAIRPDGETIQVASGYEKPNGLCLSPDEKILYVNDSGRRIIDAYDIQPDGTLANKRLFADLASEEKRGNPDGMKCDRKGNVYSTGPGGVWIFRPDGSLIGKLILPEQPANLAFGDADGRSLYFTARKSLYRIRLKE